MRLRTLISKLAVFFPGFWILLALVPSSCDTSEAERPAFIRIDTIAVDSTSFDSTGSVSHAIRFAWVYVEDNLIGVHELPAVVPVLAEGTQEITVFAGVSENGIGTQASRYPFYAFWQKNDTLVKEDTLLLEPRVRYQKGLKVPLNVTFDNSQVPEISLGVVDGNGFYNIDLNPQEAFEGSGSLELYLPPGASHMVLETSSIPVPTGKAGYFIEFNYRNNCDFLIGLRAGGTNQTTSLIGIRPRTNYNKIYVNITQPVDQLSGLSESVHIYFRMDQDTSVQDQIVRIDNLKVLY